MAKPTILLISNFLSATPTYTVSQDLADRLNSAGWKVLTASKQPWRVLRAMDMALTVWRQRHEYAVAHVAVFSGPAFIWAELACWLLQLLRKPFLLTLHGGNLPEFARRWPNRVRRLLSSAVTVTTPSRYLLEQMAAYCDDLLMLPNPLRLEAYEFRQRARPAPKLIWVRAFHKIYNPTLAPQVVAALSTEYPEACLIMVGPDKGDGAKQKVQGVVAELKIAAQVKLVGAVPKLKIPACVNQGDIFLNTTNVDNTPVSVLEAMACGLCVVSTNVGGIPYLLEHEHDALLVPPDDPAAMTAAVSRILSEPQLADKLSRNARRKAEQHDWSSILPQWERLLTTAAESKGQASGES